jgi:hypothetical protein
MEHALLRFERFRDISLDDPFFDSLKADYREFGEWFTRKGDHQGLTFRNDSASLYGFLYLKVEDGSVLETEPPLPHARRLKIGTFKVNPHGTRLGERFMKRAFDVAVDCQASALYVTIFEKHTALVQLFLRYGFVRKAVKNSVNGTELVLERRLDEAVGDVVLDYPRIPLRKNRHFILSLYPVWHSRLLPDSLLKTESSSILEDVSHANSIHKIYLAGMKGVDQLQRGDTLLIYRTAEGGHAEHTSVVTSVCVVEELSRIDAFPMVEEFLAYCAPYSVFCESELRKFYVKRKYPWIIRFTYNLSLRKRPNRKALIEKVGIDRSAYPGFLQISKQQFRDILKLSGDYEKARSLVYPS